MSAQVGQQLRQAREARQLSPAQAARDTLIRVHYLEALEAGDFKAIPSTAQARGFLRTYANYLGLDADAMLKSLEEPAQQAKSVVEVENPPAPATPPDSSKADEILQQIGQKLKQQRSLLGLALEDVERHTHLRQRYLVALENGDLNNLPSPVQGRGMLKNYASFLGLDPEPILLQFADGLQARRLANQAAAQAIHPLPRREPARPARPLPGPLQRLLSGDMLVGALLSIVLISFIVWGAARILSVQSDNTPSPTSPSIAEVLLITPSATPSPTPPPVTPNSPSGIFPGTGEESSSTETPEAIALPANQQGVQVYISVYQRAYLKVWVDGEEEFQGRVLPGSAYNFFGKERVEILTSNGAALQVFYNQQDQGILGLFGQVVHNIYTLEGLQTPTPTITATGTPTQRPSPTPQRTATPEAGAPALP